MTIWTMYMTMTHFVFGSRAHFGHFPTEMKVFAC